jgi:hypothetical protein
VPAVRPDERADRTEDGAEIGRSPASNLGAHLP